MSANPLVELLSRLVLDRSFGPERWELDVVHRDLKPTNIFLEVVGDEEIVKVLDFGLAKLLDVPGVTSKNALCGTPGYMAPEQINGPKVDQRADIYAFGVTFFELLTGKVPFVEGDVAYHHRHTPPPDPRERVEDLPDAFAELVLHMLAKDPNERCESAARVSDRLGAIAKSLS